MWVRIGGIALLFILQVACMDDPCAAYADYMCDCHADDPDVDCSELQQTLESDDPEVMDQCQLDLSDQKSEDADAGLECETSGDLDFDL